VDIDLGIANRLLPASFRLTSTIRRKPLITVGERLVTAEAFGGISRALRKNCVENR